MIDISQKEFLIDCISCSTSDKIEDILGIPKEIDLNAVDVEDDFPDEEE